MQVYDVEYNYSRRLSEEEINISIEIEKEEGNDIDKDNLPKDDNGNIEIWRMEEENHLQWGGDDYFTIANEVASLFDDLYGEDGYEILAICKIKDIDIVNWPGEGEPCDCWFCRSKDKAYEDTMHFNCPSCGEEIKILDDGWELIFCRKCNEQILREGLIDIGNNKFQAIKIENNKDDKE